MTTNNPPASPDDDCHFGQSNPLGPIDRDAATSNGNTTKTTSTTPIAHHDSLEDLEAADGESERDEDDGDQEDDNDSIRSTKFHHTTVWTTVLPSGQAFRTTRTLLLVHAPHQYSETAGTGNSQKNDKAPHRRATATPLSTLYETSTPLGPTNRVIIDYHQPYDGSYTRTTEYIRANGGSTTVKRQEFNRAGASEGREEVIEYPPMVVGRNSSGGSGGGGGGGGSPRSSNKKSSGSSSSGGNNISANGGVGSEDGTTTISELTYTLAGATTVDGGARDDPTMDPTTIDYNAGYDPRVAGKHEKGGSSSPADIFARSPHGRPNESGRPTPAGGAKAFRFREEEQQGNGITIGPSWSITENYSQGEPSATNGPFSFVTASTSSSSRRRRAKYCKYSYWFALLSVVLGLAAILGGVLSTRNKRSGAGSSAAGTDPVGDEDGIGNDEGGDDNDWTYVPADPDEETIVPPTEDIANALTDAGYTKSWPSEEGWLIAPSFASFSSIGDDIFEADDDVSYYEAFYLPDATSCAEQCTSSDAVGGAYFDLSNQNKRNVCLCFKAVECYDPTLEFSGGHVFVREEHYIPKSQKCLMSSCGYFPDDPLCSGLNIVNFETMLNLELSPAVGLMDDAAKRTFEETCASFLNDRFSRANGSPVEGIRCQVLDQDVSDRRRKGRKLQDADGALQLDLQITGLFVPTSRYQTADSVDFTDNVVRYFGRNGVEFVLGLKRDAEANGSDYFEEIQTVKRLEEVANVPALAPTLNPVRETDEPSPSPSRRPTNKPTRMPVPWPTTDVPSRKQTLRPTPKPSPNPTRQPSPRPSKKPSPRPTKRPERPTNRPTLRPTPKPSPRPVQIPTRSPPTPSSTASKFCDNSKCWVQIGELMGETLKDHFGDLTSFDSTGTRFVVSASRSSDSGFDEAGLCKVYDIKDDGDFQQRGQTLYGFEDGDEVKCVLAKDGDRLAMFAKDRDNKTGRVWILELQRSGREWVEIGKILGQEEGEKFGNCVALSTDGDIVAIGAPFANKKRGLVRVYQQTGSSWQQTDDIKGETKDAMFGWTCAVSEDGKTLAIGQKSEDSGDNEGRSGQVRVFQYNKTDEQYQLLGDPILGRAPGDDFGRAVALSASGAILGVGSRFADGSSGKDTGSVGAFSFESGDWRPNPIDGSIILGESRNDQMMNVALDYAGARIAAGGGSADDDTGYVKVFDISNGKTLKQLGGKLAGMRKGGKFGANFDINSDGTRLIIGAPARDHDNVRGSVQVFELFDK